MCVQLCAESQYSCCDKKHVLGNPSLAGSGCTHGIALRSVHSLQFSPTTKSTSRTHPGTSSQYFPPDASLTTTSSPSPTPLPGTRHSTIAGTP